MFFWNSLAFSMIQRILAIWSLVPLPFLKPAWTPGSLFGSKCIFAVLYPYWNRCFSGTLLLFRWSSGCWQFDLWFLCLSKNIRKFMVHVLLKPDLENFEHYFTRMWDEFNCAVVWACFGIAFLRDWNENWPFLVLWPLLSFPNLLAYWVQHFHSIIFQDLKQLNWNSITSTSFVRSDAF